MATRARQTPGIPRSGNRRRERTSSPRALLDHEDGDHPAVRVVHHVAIEAVRYADARAFTLACLPKLGCQTCRGEIMEALGSRGKEDALEMFLASCRTVAEAWDNPEFLRLGKEAVKAVPDTR